MTDKNKLPLTTPNPADDLLAQLHEAAPQIFSEGKIDLDKFKAALGEHVEPRIERYGLNWAGKSDAFRNVQQPSVGTLLPMPEQSVDWDATSNLIIEGDNLEVLKLLQKPYNGKVKMIYIDPPYNTGNEFIYPDNFREGLDDYLRYSGQVSEAGIKQSTNTETSGRFHSKWLNMMYPRLFLARNLLRDDGVIFVSIDDHEVHNLRMLMNEVFGEENFVANVVWQKKQSPQNDAINISAMHDHILVYARRAKQSRNDTDGWQRNLLPREEEQENRYENPDNDPRGPWTSADLTCNKTSDERPNLYFPIVNPNTGEEVWPTQTRVWGYEKSLIDTLLKDGRLSWGKNGSNFPRLKKYRADVNDGVVPSTWWPREKAGDNQEAKREIRFLFPEYDIFDTPKPVSLVKRMLQIATGKPPKRNDGANFLSVMEAPKQYVVKTKQAETSIQSLKMEEELVLDFFAGSGTTAQSVLELNREDGGNRKFILVQLPEKTDNPQYHTIADITRERVRRGIAKLNQADEGQLNFEAKPDRGFRAFKLSSSNFKIWDAAQASTEPEQLALQLQHYTDNVDDSRSRQDILYELILKAGLPLAAKVEQIEVEGKSVFSVAEGQLLICLENPITQAVLRGMMAREPLQILCLDTAFHGNDPLKTNAVLEAKSHGITFRTV